MIRRLPLIPTIIVAAAIATMIALGVWQIQRAGEKKALIARYQAAEKMPPIAFPTVPTADADLPLYRFATGNCLKPVSRRASVGENRRGDPGYVQIVRCVTGAEGPGMAVELGWSKNPRPDVQWTGGPVSGVIAPDRDMRIRLVAASAPPGLETSAKPSLDQIRNNHLSYAIQWFAFALIALVIYLLAVRKRLRGA